MFNPFLLFPVPSVAPGNLALVFSDGSLVLRWDHPSNVHPGVPVTYIVDINGTDPDTGMNLCNMTPEPMLLVAFLEEFLIGKECLVIEFSVSTETIAGLGESAAIIDTVPICELTNLARSKFLYTFFKFSNL